MSAAGWQIAAMAAGGVTILAAGLALGGPPMLSRVALAAASLAVVAAVIRLFVVP